jgi:hypothetical protein
VGASDSGDLRAPCFGAERGASPTRFCTGRARFQDLLGPPPIDREAGMRGTHPSRATSDLVCLLLGAIVPVALVAWLLLAH